ncbi:oligosaccharyl transferase stt3 subunit, partial [Kappamyces sp. JEL0680]
ATRVVSGIQEPGLKYAILGGVSVLLVLFAFHCTYVTSSAYSSPSVVLASQNRDGSQHIIDDFREAYYWLRENSHEKAKILSWWDYGYQITGFSNRTVMVDNNTWNNTHIATVGKVMSCSEEVSYEVMRKLDVDYVLVIFGGLIGYSGDDINKFLWMIRIGEGVYPKDISERKFFTDRGEYAVGAQATSTMKNSVMYKLSYYRFTELFGQGPGRDSVRGQEIPATPIKLTTMDEAYTSENMIVRIYQVKKPDNLGRPLSVASSFGKKRKRGTKRTNKQTMTEVKEDLPIILDGDPTPKITKRKSLKAGLAPLVIDPKMLAAAQADPKPVNSAPVRASTVSYYQKRLSAIGGVRQYGLLRQPTASAPGTRKPSVAE